MQKSIVFIKVYINSCMINIQSLITDYAGETIAKIEKFVWNSIYCEIVCQ